MFNIKNVSLYSYGKSEDRALEVKTPGLSSSSAEMNLASDRVLEMWTLSLVSTSEVKNAPDGQHFLC